MIAAVNEKEPFWIWPKICESEVFESGDLLKLWLWILSHTERGEALRHFEDGRRTIEIPVAAGQLALNKKHLESDLGWSRPKLLRCLERLESIGCISIRTARPFAVLDVCNWEIYQDVQVVATRHPVFHQESSHACGFLPTRDLVEDSRRSPVKEFLETGTDGLDPRRVRFPEAIATGRLVIAFVDLADLMAKKNRPLTADVAEAWIGKLLELGEERGYFALRDAIEREGKRKAAPRKYSYSQAFEKWWETYPPLRRSEKPRAFEEYRRATKSLLDSERVTIDGQQGVVQIESRDAAEAFLQRRVEAYAKSPQGRSRFSPAPHRWLRNAKFLEGRQAWASGDDESPASDHLELRAAPPPI